MKQTVIEKQLHNNYKDYLCGLLSHKIVYTKTSSYSTRSRNKQVEFYVIEDDGIVNITSKVRIVLKRTWASGGGIKIGPYESGKELIYSLSCTLYPKDEDDIQKLILTEIL